MDWQIDVFIVQTRAAHKILAQIIHGQRSTLETTQMAGRKRLKNSQVTVNMEPDEVDACKRICKCLKQKKLANII
jgi:hypothetical protein